jgi:diketogulonate reductase-like aldo/keto reductase
MVEASHPYVTLNNGIKMPQIGLGTFLNTEGDVEENVRKAIIDIGYRAIDTATCYQNEEQIGKGLKTCFEAGIKREDVFITTKLFQNDKNDIEGALRLSLKKLQLEYVDLYLIHWMLPCFLESDIDWSSEKPLKGPPVYVIWQELERLVGLGLIKSIGVSNCSVSMLVDIMAYAKIKPVTNQIELHPYNS